MELSPRKEEKIYRTYTSEEVMEALDYINENVVLERFHFRGYLKKPYVNDIEIIILINWSYRTDEIRMDEGNLRFLLYEFGKDDELIDNISVDICDKERVIHEYNIDYFEGWCPAWEGTVANVKPPHKRLQ